MLSHSVHSPAGVAFGYPIIQAEEIRTKQCTTAPRRQSTSQSGQKRQLFPRSSALGTRTAAVRLAELSMDEMKSNCVVGEMTALCQGGAHQPESDVDATDGITPVLEDRGSQQACAGRINAMMTI